MFNPQVAQLAGEDVMTVIASFSMQAYYWHCRSSYLAQYRSYR